MVEAEKEAFKVRYDEGFPTAATARVSIGGMSYEVTCGVDRQGDEDHLLFDTIEKSRNTRKFGDTMDHEDITRLIAAIEFMDEFAEDYGYEFRGPRAGVV